MDELPSLSDEMQVGTVIILSIYSEIFWTQLPVLLVWGVGLVLAWRRRREHPQAYRILRWTLGGLLLYWLVGPGAGALMAMRMRRLHWDPTSIEAVVTCWKWADALVMAVCWGLVLAVALGWRRAPASVEARLVATKAPGEEKEAVQTAFRAGSS